MAPLHCTAEGDCVSAHTHKCGYTKMYVSLQMLFLAQAWQTHRIHTHTAEHAWLDQLIYTCIGILCYEIYNSVNTVSCCPSGALRQLFVWGLNLYICVYVCDVSGMCLLVQCKDMWCTCNSHLQLCVCYVMSTYFIWHAFIVTFNFFTILLVTMHV